MTLDKAINDAAGENEGSKHNENPVEDQILPFSNEIDQGDRDGII